MNISNVKPEGTQLCVQDFNLSSFYGRSSVTQQCQQLTERCRLVSFAEEVAETFREAVPAHSLFKIQAFSLLLNNSIEKYQSNEFEAAGYKWSLSLYPDGNKAENGDGHISLYLVLEDANFLPDGWELNVTFKLFLFDQIRGKYLIRQEMEGKKASFHEMKKMHGFPQFISLAKFEDLSNGYLVDDTCVFGAEVFLSIVDKWSIDDLSGERIFSKGSLTVNLASKEKRNRKTIKRKHRK